MEEGKGARSQVTETEGSGGLDVKADFWNSSRERLLILNGTSVLRLLSGVLGRFNGGGG